MHRELEVVDVLLRQRGRRHAHAGQRHALVVADRAAFGDCAHDVFAVDVVDHQPDVAVVDQHPVAGYRVLGELLVGGGDPVVIAGAVRDRDAHGFAVGPVRRSVGETTEPNFGALQVGKDANGASGRVGGGPHAVVGRLVVAVIAVAEVQSG